MYDSLQELDQDISDVCAAIIEPIKNRERQKSATRPLPEDIKTMQRIIEFQHATSAMLAREGKRVDTPRLNGQTPTPSTNHIKKEPVPDNKAPADQQAKTVLTLFGNAPTPRQLFSSFQHSTHNGAIKTEGADLSLEELGLPNMLNATKVMPLNPTAALGSRNRKPTFADVFPPPPTLAQLNPPKPKSTNRNATISWLGGDALIPKPSRKNIYTMQPLTVGAWIDYGSRDTEKESSSAIKRRRRESVVSTAPPAKAIEDMSLAEIMAEEKALFKAAYSSFTPTVDDSKALVPEEVRDGVWWHKVGERRFDKHFILDPALEDSFPPPLSSEAAAVEDDEVTLGGTDEMKDLEAIVENFDQDAFDPELLVSTLNHDHQNAQDLLQDISNLLETLSSYQRIRNSYLAPPSSRNPTSPSPFLAAALGTPTEPNKDEVAIYKALRSRLAHLISKLPPYAVAKLDGEQLEDLAISKTIVIKGKDFKGTMEEDQLTKMIRSSNAMQAAAGSTPATRPAAATSSSYGRSSSNAQPPRSAHAPNPNYYGAARTPATSYNRSTVAQNYATPAATAPRPSYSNYNSNTVSRPPAQTSYGQTNGQPGYRPSYGPNSTFNPQQTPLQGSAQTPSIYNTAQQAQFRNSSAYNQNAALGTPSYNPQQTAQTRQGYGATATQYMQQRPNGQQPVPNSQQPQQPNSGRATPTYGANPQTPSAVGPSGFHSSMPNEQQQMMVERQRAQLTQQPLARMQAQPDMQRVVNGTPQPSNHQQQPQQPNGDTGRGANGTPMVA